MPQIKFELTLGNILSTVVSLITIGTVIVSISVFGTSMRKDIDSAISDLRKLESNVDRLDGRVTLVSNETRLALEAAAQKNLEQVTVMTEVRTDVKYLREAVQRLEAVTRQQLRN